MENRVYLLPIWETITTAWDKVHGSKSTFWACLLLLFIIMFGIGILEGILESVPGLGASIRLIASIFTYLINVSLIYIGIKRAQDLPINYKMMFHAFDKNIFLRVIGLYILQALILAIPVILAAAGYGCFAAGSIALGLLGILLICTSFIVSAILVIRISLSVGFVMDQNLGPWLAINKSFTATRGNFWNLVCIYILESIILFASAIPLGIGLIWTIPLCIITYGLVYRRLCANTQ